MTNLHAPGEVDQNSKNACWRTPVSCVVPPATSRCIIFEHSKTSPRTQVGTNRPGSARWPHGAGKPWSSVERVTRTPSDATYVKFANVICDAGKPYALKGACTVWRETDEKVPERATRQPSTLRLLPLNLDTNHGYAKEQVVNSELAKRQVVAQGRTQRLQRLAQACRGRLDQLREQDEQLEAHVLVYEQRRNELLIQVSQFEEAGRTEERNYFPLKARQVAAEWEVRQDRTSLEKNALRRLRLMDTCEGYCRELRQVLRHQEDLQAQARDMYELDHTKDQLMTLFKVGLANLGMWVRDHYFGDSYHHCGGPRLLPFFKLGGWVTVTESEVQLDVCAFNNRALARDLEEVCHKVNEGAPTLPDGRRLVVAVGKRLHARLDGPFAQTG